MIKSIKGDATKAFLAGQPVKKFEAFREQAERRIAYLRQAKTIYDLMAIRSNRFEALRGNRKGQFSIRINDRWRICFRFEEGNAYDVEITDHYR
jgi:proteic killer suppression protein